MIAKIVYSTMTGHSKKIANAVAQKLNIENYDIKDNPEVDQCDLLFIVSGIYGGQTKPELLEFAKTLNPSKIKRVALIFTSTSGVAKGTLKSTLIDAGISVAHEEFQGIGGFLVARMSRPNQQDIEDAVQFSQKMLADAK